MELVLRLETELALYLAGARWKCLMKKNLVKMLGVYLIGVIGAAVIKFVVAAGPPDNEFVWKLMPVNAAAKFFKTSFATLTIANTGENFNQWANVKTLKVVDRAFSIIRDNVLEDKQVLQVAKEAIKNKELVCFQSVQAGLSGPVLQRVRTKLDSDRELVSMVKPVKTVWALVLRSNLVGAVTATITGRNGDSGVRVALATGNIGKGLVLKWVLVMEVLQTVSFAIMTAVVDLVAVQIIIMDGLLVILPTRFSEDKL